MVFFFPSFQFACQLFSSSEMLPSIELLYVGLVAPLDLAVNPGAGGRDMAVSDAQISQMPGELGTEGGVVVGLDALDSEGQASADLVEEGHRRTCVVVVVDPQHAVAGRFVNGCELVEARHGGSEEPSGGFDAASSGGLDQAQAMVVSVSHFTNQVEVGGGHGGRILRAARRPALPPAGRPAPAASSHSCIAASPGGYDVSRLSHWIRGVDLPAGAAYDGCQRWYPS